MQANAPKVSVVIPVYNRERFIAETVQSVLDQTFQDFELITVDDGSTDGSRRVLESFGDRITILQHPGGENRGQSAAINLGMRHARGQYIALLDSDDLWLPRKLEIQTAYLDAHPDVGLVYGNGLAIDAEGRKLYDIYEPGHIEGSNPHRVLLDCYFLVPNNSLVRREVFERAGPFDESLRAAQDHDMAIRIAEITRLAYIDEQVFCYRRHPDSISRKRADVRWRNGFKILEKARQRYPYPRRVIWQRRAVLHFRLGQCYFESRAVFSALKHMLAAFMFDPLRSLSVIMGRERITSPH
jgi:glycosyltransferase involved in cell wall biosynthesis